LIHIPTDPACPALNLAQAVAVCLYELRRNGATTAGVDAAAEIAPYAQQERMFEQLQSALEEIGYFYDARAATLMHGLRRLIGRAQPTATEVDWLFGLARQLRWVARNRPRRG
jgi:tRNA/rRNA methyltransferase